MDARTLRWTDGSWSSPLPDWDGERTLVVALGSRASADDGRWPLRLREAYPHALITGCSTAGHLDDGHVDDGLTATIVRFASTDLVSAAVELRAERSFDDGRALADALVADMAAPRLVVALSDGVAVNGGQLVAGLAAGLPAGTTVFGGLAGDGDRFEQTWTLVGDRPVAGHAVVVALGGGSLSVGLGSRGGWRTFGPERRITRAKGNVLFELDGEPALDLYRHYLGHRAGELPASALLLPLSVRNDADDPNPVVRTVLGIDTDERSLTFAADIPEGGLGQLMWVTVDGLVGGAGDAAAAAMRSLGGGDEPVLALGVSCIGRRLVLGRRVEDEVDAVAEVLPPGSHHVGFYAYGEISPLADGRCGLHNQTMTLAVLAERD
ncbi:MAG: FIST N-terminal domain-containing protein [Actinomycetota bacterium]|nr:FIST N-terminal domain-containing protein [Actinomycetota bacterium]